MSTGITSAPRSAARRAAASVAARTCGSRGRPPRSGLYATRAPANGRGCSDRNSAGSSSMDSGRPTLGRRDHRHQQGGVAHGAGQRTEHRAGVPRVAGPGRGDAARGRAEPHEVAERRRVADAAAEVGTVGHRQHAARHRGGGPPLLPPAERGEVVGVARDPEHVVERVGADTELRVFVFPTKTPPAPRMRPEMTLSAAATVPRGCAIRGRGQPRDVHQILHRERQAVQRAQRQPARLEGVEFARAVDRLLGTVRHDRVDRGLIASMRSRCARTTSSDDTSRRRIASARADAERRVRCDRLMRHPRSAFGRCSPPRRQRAWRSWRGARGA